MERLLKGSDKVELIQDHNPLRWLCNQRDPWRTLRWILELEEYNYEIRYKTESPNVLPEQSFDAEVQDVGRFEEKVFITNMEIQKTDNIRSGLSKDQVIARAKRDLERESCVSSGKSRRCLHIFI